MKLTATTAALGVLMGILHVVGPHLIIGRVMLSQFWLYLAWMAAFQFGLPLVLLSAELREKRQKWNERDFKEWDKVLVIVMSVPILFYLNWIVAFEWWWREMDVPAVTAVTWVGGIVTSVASVTWWLCARDNPFFTALVETQQEKHRVVREGWYSLVRHPGYTNLAAIFIGLALFFWRSDLVLFCSFGAVCLLVVRTAWEDEALAEDLPGYALYRKEVPYRLVPGVW